MPLSRSPSGPEITILNAPDRIVIPRLEIQNASGTWKSFSGLTVDDNTLDFLLGLQWQDDIDAPTWTGTVQLAAAIQIDETTSISIATYMESSPANVDDLSAPAPAIEGMRRIRWFTTTKNIDGDAATEHKVFDGYVVEVDDGDTEIGLNVSDLGHLLVITQIEDERIYDWNGVTLGDAIQQVLDDNMGVGVIPLVVDPSVSSVVLSSKTKVERRKVMETIRDLAQLTVGANVRYMWNGENMELRLFMPPRTKVVSDFTYNKNRMYPSTNFVEKTDDVRNVGIIKYRDAEKKAVVSIPYIVPASVTKYGRRYFEFVEDATSQINTEAEARAFIKTAIDDLAQPKAEKRFGAPYNWAAGVWDLFTLTANDIQYSSDQDQGVTQIQHSIGAGGEATTQFSLRGNIAGYSRKWIAVEGLGPKPPDENIMAIGISATPEGTMYGGELFNGKVDGCYWIELWVGLNIRRVHVWGRQTKQSFPVIQWPPTTSQIYKAIMFDKPEGKIPREGNYTIPSGPFAGRRVWRMLMPVPTTPELQRALISQAEDFDGNFGPASKFVDVAVDGGPDPGGYGAISVDRIDATTVQVGWTPDEPNGQTLIFRDGVCIDYRDDDGTDQVWLDEDLHADKKYNYQINKWKAGQSGVRTIVFIDPWTTSLAFSADPDFFMLSGQPRVRIQAPTGVPVGTAKIRIRKSVDSGHYDPWTTVTEIDIGDFPYYDAVVFAGQFYDFQALDSGGAVLDTSLPAYWTNPGA